MSSDDISLLLDGQNWLSKQISWAPGCSKNCSLTISYCFRNSLQAPQLLSSHYRPFPSNIVLIYLLSRVEWGIFEPQDSMTTMGFMILKFLLDMINSMNVGKLIFLSPWISPHLQSKSWPSKCTQPRINVLPDALCLVYFGHLADAPLPHPSLVSIKILGQKVPSSWN